MSGCHKEIYGCCKDDTDDIGLHLDQLWILITPGIRKPFMEKSSSFPTDTSHLWRMPQGYYGQYGRVYV